MATEEKPAAARPRLQRLEMMRDASLLRSGECDRLRVLSRRARLFGGRSLLGGSLLSRLLHVFLLGSRGLDDRVFVRRRSRRR
jgi:hypothetical protein